MTDIKIGSVKMPLADFVVSRNAILGITKSGKTYTAKGVAEQLLEHDIPIIVFDAIGVWRYLKTPGDGPHAKGFKVVVAGGEHPDLPLTPQSAPEIVRAAIKENIPLVIDLYDSRLSKADWRRIVQACFRVLLYENKGLRHVFLEESAEFAPQKVTDGETYAEVEKLARMGGNKGVGITFINQRAQELNKAVLELCDNVVLLRQRGSHAIDSLEKQMDRLAPDMAKEIAQSMPRMTQGECWIFTEKDELPVRTRSGLIKSLHPDRRMPEQALSSRKSVDADSFVETLSGQLSQLFEEQKANDPLALKKRVAELEKQLKSQRPSVEVREVSVLTDKDRTMIEEAMEICAEVRQACNARVDDICKIQSGLQHIATNGKGLPTVKDVQKIYRTVAPVVPKARSVVTGDSSIGKCERSILTALAQYPQGRTANQVAVLTGYSVSSGGFNNSLSRLRSLEFINRGQPMMITNAGANALGDFTPLPTGEDLQRHWLQRLGKCEAAILEMLLAVYPEGRMADEVARSTNYQPSSGGFNNSLSRLRTLELITRGQPMKASDDFFQ